MFQHAFTFLAKAILKKYNPDIVAITGSVGKTSTREACFSVLKKKYRVRKSEKNYNTDFSIPITIIGGALHTRSLFNILKIIVKALWFIIVRVKSYPEILVLELSADKPGDIARFMSYIKPYIGIVTTVSNARLEQFGTLQRVIAEKRLVYANTKANGFIIVNSDDVLVDVGCGKGRFFNWALSKGYKNKIIGI